MLGIALLSCVEKITPLVDRLLSFLPVVFIDPVISNGGKVRERRAVVYIANGHRSSCCFDPKSCVFHEMRVYIDLERLDSTGEGTRNIWDRELL